MQLDEDRVIVVDVQASAQWTDILWVPVLGAAFIALIVVAGIDLDDYVKTHCYESSQSSGYIELINSHSLVVLSCSSLTAVILSILYFVLAFTSTKHFIRLTMAFQVLACCSMVAYHYSRFKWFEGTVYLLWLLLIMLIYMLLRGRINRATEILNTTLRIAQNVPALFILSAVGSVISAAVSLLCGTMMVANYGKYNSPECSKSGDLRSQSEFLACMVFISFMQLALTEHVKASVRMTVASVYGDWYYAGKTSNISCGRGLFHSLSYSLGTASVGCLLVALGYSVAHYIRALGDLQLQRTDDASVILAVWLISAVLLVLGWILSQFNNYVYIFSAVYNYSYLEAARRTVELFHKQGIKAVTVDCLAGGILAFGPWTISAINTGLFYVYLRFLSPRPIEGLRFILSYVMVFGTQIASIFATPISSGVITLFATSFTHPECLDQEREEGVLKELTD